MKNRATLWMAGLFGLLQLSPVARAGPQTSPAPPPGGKVHLQSLAGPLVTPDSVPVATMDPSRLVQQDALSSSNLLGGYSVQGLKPLTSEGGTSATVSFSSIDPWKIESGKPIEKIQPGSFGSIRNPVATARTTPLKRHSSRVWWIVLACLGLLAMRLFRRDNPHGRRKKPSFL